MKKGASKGDSGKPSRTKLAALRSPAAAASALLRRLDLRLVSDLARERGDEMRVVGGAVRDAFLGREGGDLDLTLPSRSALLFAQELGSRLGCKAIVVGAERRRIIRLPTPHGEIEIWESEGRDEDRDRRDFTVNALSFDPLSRNFDGPESAFADLTHRRLVLPRAGVLEEDPVRVLRAARLEVQLGEFRLSAGALPEARRAAALLPNVTAERLLAELTKILSRGKADAARALDRLDGWGALAALMPDSSPTERRLGIRSIRRASGEALAPEVSRALLVRPLGEMRARAVLSSWKVSRQELRLATHLVRLSGKHQGPISKRAIVAWIRESAPFAAESFQALEAVGDASGQRLAEALRPIVSRPARLAKILAPARFLSPEDVRELLHLSPGPELGRALEALDRAVAAAEVKSRAGAERFVRALTTR